MSLSEKVLAFVNAPGFKKFMPWFALGVCAIGASAALYASCQPDAQKPAPSWWNGGAK